VLFASYLRPELLDIASLRETLSGSLAPCCRDRRSHFGFYPFRWREGWEKEADSLLVAGEASLQLAPVLERLVFPRARQRIVAWIRLLAALGDVRWLVPAHYAAPVAISCELMLQVAAAIDSAEWAPDSGSWATLSGIDRALVKFGLVPLPDQQSL
jgi:hypothetical protein